MKKFNFSLQKILDIKEQILKNLKFELGNLNTQYVNLELEIQLLNDKYKTTNDEIVEKSSKSISVGEISYFKMYLNNILISLQKKELPVTVTQKEKGI